MALAIIVYAVWLFLLSASIHLAVAVTKRIFGLESISGLKLRIVFLSTTVITLLAGTVLITSKLFTGPLIILTAPILIVIIFAFLMQKFGEKGFWRLIGVSSLLTITTFIATFALAASIQHFLVSSFFVEGDSMVPALEEADYLLVNRLSREYARGDIVTFTPKSENWVQIARIIGLPGERIDVANGYIFINEKTLEEFGYETRAPKGVVAMTLDKDEYFILSDKRSFAVNVSANEPVSRDEIHGKIFLKQSVSSLTKFETIPSADYHFGNGDELRAITFLSPVRGTSFSTEYPVTLEWGVPPALLNEPDFNIFIMLYAEKDGASGIQSPIGDGFPAATGKATWDVPGYVSRNMLSPGTYRIVGALQAVPKDVSRLCAVQKAKDCSPSQSDAAVMLRVSEINGATEWFKIVETR